MSQEVLHISREVNILKYDNSVVITEDLNLEDDIGTPVCMSVYSPASLPRHHLGPH